MEVCRLSPMVMSLLAQPLSTSLQGGIRFFQDVLPAILSAFLAVSFPKGKITGLPRSIYLPKWVRFCLFTDDHGVCDEKRSSSHTDRVPFGLSLSASLAYYP